MTSDLQPSSPGPARTPTGATPADHVPRCTVSVHGRWDDEPAPSYAQELIEVLRVVMVAGIGWGLVCAGLVGRLAMFVLRLTSPTSVRGVVSDDGFVIGRFTLSGTYNLAVVGAAVGVIGAAAYLAVAPWLIGPLWFRRFTVAVTSAAIGGAATIHRDGIDFQALEPQALAIALFILLPLVFGLGLSVTIDRVARRDSWTRRGSYAWGLPLVLLLLLVANPLVVTPFVVSAALAVLLVVRRHVHDRIAASATGTLVARGFYLAIAVYGFVLLGMDVADFA
ncbi:hypothetical protein [Phycicoccus sp. Root101]|uniref:hypothetical protein n=1 Tax=Phycicoccus sp. Root101 TaxID=1736421 RepID=UPI000AC7F455|nr:hypothetical protein [Phycicoccus sp. Root101]